MVALGGCIGGSPRVHVYSLRDGPVGVTVQILETTNEEPLADEHVTVKPPGNDEYSADYDVMGGDTYRITVSTDDDITGTHRWDVPSRAGDRSLDVGIKQGEIKFGVSMP